MTGSGRIRRRSVPCSRATTSGALQLIERDLTGPTASIPTNLTLTKRNAVLRTVIGDRMRL